MDEYRLVRPLGEGTFGQVYEAIHNHSQQTVAIKLVQFTHGDDSDTSDEEDSLTSNRELAALLRCQHPNVVQLHSHFVHQHALALVLQCMDAELALLLQQCQRTATAISLHATRAIAHQLLTAIAHIHSLGVLHRDIKPSNILLSLPPATQHPTPRTQSLLRLSDFGQASCVDSTAGRPLSPAVSTRWYKAPELLLPSDGSTSGGQLYGSGVDVWAAGCVVAECVSGAVLLAGSSDVEQLSRIAVMCGRQGGEGGWEVVETGSGVRRLLGEDEEGEKAEEGGTDGQDTVRRDVLDLLDSMLRWDPLKRITARQALSHPFFTRTATMSQSTDAATCELVRCFEQTKKEPSVPHLSTTELLQQPLTIGRMLSHCLPAPHGSTQQQLQQRLTHSTATV